MGVSNFGVHHLEELRKAGRPIPSVNQIELHPFLKQTDIVNYCRTHNIALMAYAPVARMTQATHPTLTAIAARFHYCVYLYTPWYCFFFTSVI